MKNNLIVCIVPHGKGELITDVATKAGAQGASIVMGRGIASSSILQALALADSSKDIIYIVVESEKVQNIITDIKNFSSSKRKGFGVLFTLNVSAVLKNSIMQEGDSNMNNNTSHRLISVIVNRGYADDVMTAARKAGAGGGTVINARGTADPSDEKFFGMEIVPEKEMLAIVVESEKENSILKAVRSLPCLETPGSGIAFSCPASDFTILGKNA